MTLIPSFRRKHRKQSSIANRSSRHPVIISSWGHDSVQVAAILESKQQLEVKFAASKLGQFLVLSRRRSENEERKKESLRTKRVRGSTLCLFERPAYSPEVEPSNSESSKLFTCFNPPHPHPLSFILHVLFVSFGVAGVIDLLVSTCSIGLVYIVAGVVIR